jgi:transcriptional regulator with XRE-family HTH domain
MNKLSRLLQEYMTNKELSEKDVAQRIGVNRSVIRRVVNNQSIDIDTLLKITDLLGVPIEEILDIKEDEDEILKQISWILSIDPNLSEFFGDIARGILKGDYEKRTLAEVAAYTMYRLNQKIENAE